MEHKYKIGVIMKKGILIVLSTVCSIGIVLFAKKKIAPCDICGGSGYFVGEFYGSLAPIIYTCGCKK